MDKTLEAVARAIYEQRGLNQGGYALTFEQINPVRRAALELEARAAIEAYEAAQWQPIETAPTDRLLLLACVTWPPARMRGEEPPMKVGGFWNGRWNVFGGSWNPTHWRPLPPAPRSEGEI